MMLGIIYDKQLGSVGHKSIDFFNDYVRLEHLILCASIIPLSSFLVASVNLFEQISVEEFDELDKRLREKEDLMQSSRDGRSIMSTPIRIQPRQKRILPRYLSNVQY